MIRSSDCAMGVVVASPDNQNPSTTAAFLLKESTLGLEAQQLLRPCILVGQAATEYAKQNKIFNFTLQHNIICHQKYALCFPGI